MDINEIKGHFGDYFNFDEDQIKLLKLYDIQSETVDAAVKELLVWYYANYNMEPIDNDGSLADEIMVFIDGKSKSPKQKKGKNDVKQSKDQPGSSKEEDAKPAGKKFERCACGNSDPMISIADSLKQLCALQVEQNSMLNKLFECLKSEHTMIDAIRNIHLGQGPSGFSTVPISSTKPSTEVSSVSSKVKAKSTTFDLD